MIPYKEYKITKKISIRYFNKEVDSYSLKWHWDGEDRKVIPLNKSRWLFQYDNQLPQLFKRFKVYKIKAGEYHRLIKDSRDSLLVLVIRK